MRTAEEILKVITCNGCREIEEERALQAMREYAIEVAREALKNASENFLGQSDFAKDTRNAILDESNIPEI